MNKKMNKRDDLEKRIATEIKNLGGIHDLITNTPILDDLADGVEVVILNSKQLVIRVINDYPLLLETLKLLRIDIMEKLKVGTKWFSCGVMMFGWKVGQLDIWFECAPDAIPKELMPSDKCHVEEYIKEPEKTYSIVCDIEGGE